MVTLQLGAMTGRLNIRQIKPYKYEEYAWQFHISSVSTHIYKCISDILTSAPL